MGHPPRLTAIDRDDVQLALLVFTALGNERDPLAVRTEARLVVGRIVTRELARGPAGSGNQPQVAEAFVLVDVVAGYRHHHQLSVRRKIRITDSLQLPHGFGGERRCIGGRLRMCRAEKEQGAARESRQYQKSHKYSLRRGKRAAVTFLKERRNWARILPCGASDAQFAVRKAAV